MRCALSTAVGYRSWALLLLLLMPFSTRAATENVDKHLASIKQLYTSTEYERAYDGVLKAQQEHPSDEQKVTLSLYEGILLYELRKPDQAEQAIRAAFTLQRDAALPVEVAPKVQSDIERIRQSIPPPPPPPPSGRSGQKHLSTLQKLALIPAIVGGVAVVAGGGFYIAGSLQLSRLENNDPRIVTDQDAQAVEYRGRTWQTWGEGLLGVGTAGLATALSMYWLGSPDSSSTALGFGTNGTSAFVYGRWP